MSFEDIKNWIFSLFEKLSKKDLLKIVLIFRNKIEDQEQEIKKNKEENQKLEDEINKLKGEKGSPKIKSNNKEKDDDSDANPKSPKKRGKKQRNKKDSLIIHRKIELKIDKNALPIDAKFCLKILWVRMFLNLNIFYHFLNLSCPLWFNI